MLMTKNIDWKKKKYLQACRIMDIYNKRANVCKIRIENDKITCNGVFQNRPGLCCKGCEYLRPNGCNTKSLGCKLSYCFIKDSPADCNLIFRSHPDNLKFKMLVEKITTFFLKHGIPIYWERISMEKTFEKFNKSKIFCKFKIINNDTE